MKLFHKATDERVSAETNRIYKIGFIAMDIGIIIDIMLKTINIEWGQNLNGHIPQFEVLVLIVSNLLCTIMMVHKGFMDDNAYAEADVFPAKHYISLSLGVGAAFSAAYVVLMALSNQYWADLGAGKLLTVAAITFLSMFLFTAAAILAALYITFRVAKKRRDKIDSQNDDE